MHDVVAQRSRDLVLQLLDPIRFEFNDVAGLDVDEVVVMATATLITPVAIPPAAPAQWYVPYVGPAPYSYATPPWPTTNAISSGVTPIVADSEPVRRTYRMHTAAASRPVIANAKEITRLPLMPTSRAIW